MGARQNCWERKGCGREPGGAKAAALGVCPAAVERRMDGANGGVNAGRGCWAVAGTLCGGKIQGTFASKQRSCLTCDHYQAVRMEEGKAFLGIVALTQRLH